MTYSPLTTFGPLPLISVFATSAVGGEDFGKVSVGALPALALTVGKVPPPADCCAPAADAVSAYDLSTSMTNTSVALPVMPSCGRAVVRSPCAGGITARTRLPTFLPISADSRPGSIVPPITVGLLVKVFAFSEELVPDQKYRTKFAARASALVKVVPAPWMSVLTSSWLPALAFGMFTVGALPNKPVAVTDELAPAGGVEDDELDEPQPARTAHASRGTAVSARKRRIRTSRVVDVSAASLLARPSGRAQRSGVPQLTHSGGLSSPHPATLAPRSRCCSSVWPAVSWSHPSIRTSRPPRRSRTISGLRSNRY